MENGSGADKTSLEGADAKCAFCVLVASSDRARDVFEVVFQNSATIWADCAWPRYVGFTSKHPDIYGFKALAAKKPSDWRGELGEQIDQLPPEIKYVLLIIEDFFFLSPVKQASLDAVADEIVRRDLAYVRLVSAPRNHFGRLIKNLKEANSTELLQPLDKNEPYYSSVELAIWKREYLRKLLSSPGSIWEFENIKSAEQHYAVRQGILEYRALVGRGMWYRGSKAVLKRYGYDASASPRATQSRLRELARWRERIAFEVFGFTGYRIRRRLNRLPRR